MEKKKQSAKFSRYIVAIVVVISGAVGYMFGKALAEQHNAQDARETPRAEVLDR